MLNKKILLISYFAPSNVGLRIISSIIKKKYDVSFLFFMDNGTFDFHIRGTSNNINLASILNFCSNYDYILVSSTSFNKELTYMITDGIKKFSNKIKTIIGGPLGIFEYTEAIKHCNAVCVWDGENILSLLDSFDNDTHVSNFIKDGSIPTYSMSYSLDELPYQDYETKNQFFYIGDKIIKNQSFKPHFIHFETMRGCIYNCSFCHISVVNKIKLSNGMPILTFKSMRKVIDELMYLKKVNSNISYFIQIDENFLFRKKAEITYFVKEYNSKIKIPLLLQCDFRSTNFIEKIKIISDLNVEFTILLGIQSGSESFNLKTFNRLQPINDTLKKYNEMLKIFINKKCRFKIKLLFIYGHPNEKRKDIIKTINLLLKLDDAVLDLLAFSPLPHMKMNNLKLNSFGYPPYSYFNHNSFYYFLMFVIITLKSKKMRSILPKKFKRTIVTDFMCNQLFTKIYYALIIFVYRRFQNQFNRKLLFDFYKEN